MLRGGHLYVAKKTNIQNIAHTQIPTLHEFNGVGVQQVQLATCTVLELSQIILSKTLKWYRAVHLMRVGHTYMVYTYSWLGLQVRYDTNSGVRCVALGTIKYGTQINNNVHGNNLSKQTNRSIFFFQDDDGLGSMDFIYMSSPRSYASGGFISQLQF